MRELDVRIVGGDAGDRVAPESRALEDVGLVDGEDFAAALAGQVKGNAGDAFDFMLAVAHGVKGLTRAGSAFDAAWLAKIGAAEQLADDHDVGAFDDFRAQRGIFQQGRKADGRAQVGEGAEFLAQAEESGFGAQVRGILVVGGQADGAEQDSSSVPAGFERIGGQRVVAGGEGGASDVLAGELEFVVEAGGYGFEHTDCLFGDFRADAVAGHDSEVEKHAGSPGKDTKGAFYRKKQAGKLDNLKSTAWYRRNFGGVVFRPTILSIGLSEIVRREGFMRPFAVRLRRRIRYVELVVAVIAGCVLHSSGLGQSPDTSSLGDLARKQRAKQQQGKNSSAKSKKVVSDEDLPARGTSGDEVPPRDGPHAEISIPRSATDMTQYGDQLKTAILRQKAAIADLKGRIEKLNDSIHFVQANAYRNGVEYNKLQAQKQQEVERLQGQLGDQQRDLEQMQETARKAGYGGAVWDP